MTPLPGISSCIIFTRGFGDFCAGRYYAIVAIQELDFILVEIDLRHLSIARYVRRLKRSSYSELYQAGHLTIGAIPSIPTRRTSDIEDANRPWEAQVSARLKKLKPLIEAKTVILSALDPARKCNEFASAAGLNITRAREQFFLLAAYSFEPTALLPAYWNSGARSHKKDQANLTGRRKRGPKVKNANITPPGWAFDYDHWPEKIMSGWKTFAHPGVSYQEIYALTLHHKFKCICDKSRQPALFIQPNGESFPSRRQFSNYIIGQIGISAWKQAKYGAQTIRNRTTSSARTVGENLINLLEEVHWDAQVLDEIPGDVRDPTQPGKPLIRVVATCGTCGGPCGVGYDYGSESTWGYLMALLCMAMKKSEFGALFGVDISDDDWPAFGVMAAIRGDRGPAIGRPVTEIFGTVLRISQEWAASYDPVGKPIAEAGHYKTLKIEGKPQRSTVFRSPMEIIRDDLRRTVAKFRSADMSHRLDPEQVRRLLVGTPRTIWNDLVKRGLYAGQIVPHEKLIPMTLPCHEVSIREDGVHLGGLRYLSSELHASGLLERARGDAIPAKAYAMNMATKHIWLQINNALLQLTAVPVRFNAMEISHSLTLEESLFYQERMAESRRVAEQETLAIEMYNEAERIKDHKAIEEARRRLPSHRSSGKAETIRQHRQIFKRK